MVQALLGHRDTCAQATARVRFFSSAIKLLSLGLLALALVPADAAQAQTVALLPNSRPIASIGTARPVLGWVRFCERHPDECRVDISEPATVTMTPQIWRTIVLVNRRVNGRIKPKTDKEHWGVVDSWDFPDDGYGDCEDYQLLK